MDDTTSYTGPAVYTTAIVIALLSGVSVILDLPPLIWHARNHNLAAASLVFWVILLNFMYFLNAIIWRNDDLASWYNGQGLCDIEIKLQVATWVALPGSLACIMRNLARVMDTENFKIPTKQERRRQLLLDGVLCFGFPLLIAALSVIPQQGRYFLFGISGCAPSFDTTWPTLVVVFIWPAILSLVDAYYASKFPNRLSKLQGPQLTAPNESSSSTACNATVAHSPKSSRRPERQSPASCASSSWA